MLRGLARGITVTLIVAAAVVGLLVTAASAQTGSPPQQPARPEVTAVTHDSVTISWADPGDASITGYQILRRNRATDAPGVFTIIEDDTGSADTTYTDTTVVASTSYVYRVKARNAHGLSPRSRYRRAGTPDEPVADTEQQTVSDLGNITYFPRLQSSNGTLDGAAGASDLYRFELDRTMSVEIALHQQDADADLAVEDDTGAVVAESLADGRANEWIKTWLEPGMYFVRVTAREAGANAYVLRYQGMLATIPQELGDITDRVSDGIPGWYVAGGIQGRWSSYIYFRFTLRETKTVHLLVRNQEADADLRLEHADGTVLRASRTSGTADELIVVTLPAGTWYARLERQVSSHPGYVFSYWVSAPGGPPSGEPDDYADDAANAGTLPVGSTVKGNIETIEDEDWFNVDLEGGQTYRFDLTGSANPYIHEVRDETGAAIADSTAAQKTQSADEERSSASATTLRGILDSRAAKSPGTAKSEAPPSAFGPLQRAPQETSDTTTAGDGTTAAGGTTGNALLFGNGWAEFTPEDAGTYQIGTRSDKGPGPFTMELRQVMDDFSDDTSTSGALTLGTSTTGDIQSAGDQDWFSVTLEAGKIYQIDLQGAQTSHGTLRDPYLPLIRNSSGNSVAGTSDLDGGAGTNSQAFLIPRQAGTYYVVAAGERNMLGTYTLLAQELADDFGATTSTAGTIAVGESTTGEIEHPGDQDWFGVTLTAGKTYRFDAMGSWTGHGTLLDPYLYGIRRPDGTLIPNTGNNDSGAEWNSRVSLAIATTGTYYMAAGGLASAGTYTVSVLDVTDGPPDDYPADTSTTATVAVGGRATGNVQYSNDVDWFKVTLEADKTYQFDLMGAWVGKGTHDDPMLRGLYNASGTLIPDTADVRSGIRWSAKVVLASPGAGTYFVAAGGLLQYLDREGTYTLAVTDVTPGQADDYAAGTGTTGAVTVGGSATGTIGDASDHDWFKVTLEANKVYRFDLKGGWSGDGTLENPSIGGIHNSTGTAISGTADTDSGHAHNARVFFTPSAAGDYFVVADGDIVGPTPAEGTYTLTATNITDGLTDDFTATIATSGAVVIGESATGEIGHPGDRDWFAVNLQAGTRYQFDLKGAPTGDGLPGHGTLADPYLYGIHSSSGTLISGTTDDNGGVSNYSRVVFTASSTAKHFVAAGGDSGTYTLYVAGLADDDYAASTSTTGTVAIGSSVTGEIETEGDRDWFEVSLQAGTTYRFDLRGARTRDGTLFDPSLHGIQDAAGSLIAGTADDDGGLGLNSRSTFTPTQSGVHYVVAGADRDWTGSYALYVEEVTP